MGKPKLASRGAVIFQALNGTGKSMNGQSGNQSTKRNVRIFAGLAVLLLGGLLAGCSSPGDEGITQRLGEAYSCKGMEVVEMNKTDSLPGIYSYVAKYTFQYRIVDGDKAALDFYRNLIQLAEVKGNDWKAAVNAPKVQAYMLDECSEAAQPVVEGMFEDVLTQLAEKKDSVRLPVMMPMSGWSEFMPGRKGWDMTMRRDKIGDEPVYGEPVKRSLLLVKAPAKPATKPAAKPKQTDKK